MDLEARYEAASEHEARRIIADTVAGRVAKEEAEQARLNEAARKAQAKLTAAQRERKAALHQRLREAQCTFKLSGWPRFPKVR